MSDPETTVASLGTESSTSTTAISPISVAPSYLIYGWEGVTRVHDGELDHLTAEPVLWAAEDGAGGIVFRSVAEQPGWAWLPAGTDRPRHINLGDQGWPHLRSVFLFEGRPSVLASRSFEGMSACEPRDYFQELTILDLETGEERFLMCHNEGPDAGESFTSFGGGLFLSVAWGAVGASGTNSFLWFYDLDGERVTVEHNPFADSCAPCHLSAQLSSDGSLLAYALWPTAYWQQPEPSDGDYTSAHREWREQQQDIPTQVVVMDIATGEELFRTDAVADAALAGFDGRMVTVTTGTGRELLDIATAASVQAPPERTEAASFWTVILASLDNTEMDYDAAQVVVGDLAAQHAVDTGVLWSDGYVALNPGYWAVFTGHFPNRDEAVAYCQALETDCYARQVATADVNGPQPHPAAPGLVLRHDGLGAVSFGDPVDDAMAVLVEHFGVPNHDELYESPFDVPPGWDRADRGPDACHVATHGHICFDYFRSVWWEDAGIWVLFSDLGFNPDATPDDDDFWVQVPPSFQGWGYRGNASAPLYTAHGITVGSTTQDLQSLGPRVAFSWDGCGWQAGFAISEEGQANEGRIYGLLDDQDLEAFEETGIPKENAKVLSLNAGQGSSC